MFLLLRHPIAGLASIPNPIGSFLDKLRVGLLRLSLSLEKVDDLLKKPESSTLKYLQVEADFEFLVKV